MAVLGGLLTLIVAAPAHGFDLRDELANYSKQLERARYVTASGRFATELADHGTDQPLEFARLLLRDPTRQPYSVCSGSPLCGDPRVMDFADGEGVVRQVSYTNRNGATIDAHLFAPRRADYPGPQPGVIIACGDLAPETVYWWLAVTLARHGYVVLTYDPQGHGESDILGSGATTTRHVALQNIALLDLAPLQESADHDATEQLVDALDYFTSTRNPLAARLDRSRIGVTGHSRGASAASIVGEHDPRVDAIVALDNLTLGGSSRQAPGSTLDHFRPRVPAMGIAADYYVAQQPYTADPDPQADTGAFRATARAGIDAMQITIRGESHFGFSFTPELPGTLRGVDLTAWYETAWFDKELRGDPTADARLLSNRWRSDAPGASVDSQGDGNLFSFYYRSRLDFRLTEGGDEVRCDNLRRGCAALRPERKDGYPGAYWYVDDRGS